ncbi:MAG: PilZ domain-containing protein [Acidobacteriaceae bacterium]|nr:PilZ domain-containing protein [Acidobacteriaceae bacterium]
MLQTPHPASGNSPNRDTCVPLFALDASDEHVPARIHSISSEAVQLRTRLHVNPGRRFVMHYEGCRKELEVITCQQGEEGDYHLNCKVETSQDGTVRDDWRMAVKWPAQVEISGSKNTYKAQVRDISVFGLGIQLPFQPELDSLLIVRMKSGVGFGRVRHCRQAARGTYIAGLYLEEFRPKEQNAKEFACQEAGISQGLGRLLHKVAHCLSGSVTRSV